MNSRSNKQYKCLPFLVMLSITLLILVRLLEQKVTWLADLAIGDFLFYLWYPLNDIIAEVYGYRIAMKVFWSLTISRFIFTTICFLLIHAPSLPNWHGQNDYDLVFKYTWSASLINPFLLLIAWWMNAKLLTKWKILTKGKYFWLRSIGSSGIAQIIYSSLIILKLIFFYKLIVLVQMTLCVIPIGLSITALLAYPSTIIVSVIKIIEKIDVNEHQLNFNPFKNQKISERNQ